MGQALRRRRPFAAYAANDAGPPSMASSYPQATFIYRDVEASTVNPTDYGRDPAEMTGWYWRRTLDRLPSLFKDAKTACGWNC